MTVRGTVARVTSNPPRALPPVLSVFTWFPQQFHKNSFTITEPVTEEIGMESLNHSPKASH